MKKKKESQPWDFVPANYNERGNFPAGAGDYQGKGLRNKPGRVVSSSTIRKAKDKKSGFKKPITQA